LDDFFSNLLDRAPYRKQHGKNDDGQNGGCCQHQSASGSRRDEGCVQVTIAVRDTGIGIRPEQVGSIFESFHQLETGLSRNCPASGLELAGLKNCLFFSVAPSRWQANWGDAACLRPRFLCASQATFLRVGILTWTAQRLRELAVHGDTPILRSTWNARLSIQAGAEQRARPAVVALQ
jgi:hypothetical protein